MHPLKFCDILSDGSDEASLIALRASADLDIAADLLANAEEEDAELAEQRIEDALEALLDAEIAGNDDESVSFLKSCNLLSYPFSLLHSVSS